VGLNKMDRLFILETMHLIRATDLMMIELNHRGEIEGHMLPCLGQEAIPATLAMVYSGDDPLITAHRGGGHYIARGCDYNAYWAELYARVTGVTRGRGGHLHLMDISRKTITGNAIVGQHWGIATGAGYIARRDKHVVIAVGGEGSTNRGTFHESLNMAAVQELPIFYVIEFNNNQMYSSSDETTAGESISERAAPYHMPGITIDGNDPDAIFAQASLYYEHVKNGKGPVLMECITQKWTDSVHNVRQDPAVVEEMKKPENDCIGRFEIKLRSEGILTDEILEKILERVQKKLNDALEFAVSSPKPDSTDGLDSVFSQPV